MKTLLTDEEQRIRLNRIDKAIMVVVLIGLIIFAIEFDHAFPHPRPCVTPGENK